jgi:hypothetical protein
MKKTAIKNFHAKKCSLKIQLHEISQFKPVWSQNPSELLINHLNTFDIGLEFAYKFELNAYKHSFV